MPGCNPVAVIIEFLAGACAGLDEHTAFHPPGTRSTAATGPTVTGATMSDERLGVGYLRITEFADTTSAEFDAAVAPLKMRGLRSLVVDLRGNPGGLLTAGIDVARKLLPPGVIVRTVGQSPEFANREFVSDSATPAFDLPLVLLVDAGTMSAAEVVAGAVKDHRRGTLVGTRTHGKGTVQVPVKTATADKTTPAGVIVLTVARTTGPAGQPLAHGIVPDVPERDPERQLKTAIAEARALAATGRPMN